MISGINSFNTWAPINMITGSSGGGYSGTISVGTALSSSEDSTPKPSLMKTIVSDIKSFITEHRTVIYGLVLILLVDHFFLGNKLTARIKAMAEKMLGVVEKKVDAVAGTHLTTINVAAPSAPIPAPVS